MKRSPVTFECSHCGAAFADAEGLKVHAERHRVQVDGGVRARPWVTFACSHCGAAFADAENLKVHAERHRVHVDGRVRAQPWVTFACSHCGVAFADAENLKAHAARHSGRIEARAAARPSVTFVCPDCGIVFFSGEELRCHAPYHRGLVSGEQNPRVGRQPDSVPAVVGGAARGGEAVPFLPAPVSDPDDAPGRVPEPVSVGARMRVVADTQGPIERRTVRAKRRRRRSRRRMARAVAVLTAVGLSGLLVAVALGWFTTSAALSGSISTGTWGDRLTLSCGGSKASHWQTSGCQLAPIAALDRQGNLTLDFGDVLSPSSSSWSDVFRVTSSAPTSLHVSFSASGAIAAFIRSVSFVNDTTGGSLNPKQARSVAVLLVVPQNVAAGTYTGTLTVAVVGDTERHLIPMTVTVLGKTPPSPSPSCSPSGSPSCSPSGSPSCSPTGSPSCSPSGSPSCSPTGSPSCSPSGSPSCTPTVAPTCTVSPTPTQLFGLAPGTSRVLPGTDTPTPPPTVANVQADGTIKLDFGDVPRAQKTTYSDVLRVSSMTDRSATVNLALSGPAATLVRRVGFWDSRLGIVTSGLQLKKGETRRIAFELYAPPRTPLGSESDTLTIAAKLANGQSQQNQLPMVIDVVTTGTTTSASPSGSPTKSATSSTSAPPASSPSAKVSPTSGSVVLPTPSPSSAASASPSPSAGVFASPSPSSSATLGVLQSYTPWSLRAWWENAMAFWAVAN